MTELELVRRIRRLARSGPSAGVALGIGDDCAVFRSPGSREEILLTTDLLVEGTHFLRETHPAETVGHKALARGLSDVAAMGGAPRFCLVSLALPEWAGPDWVESFYRGLMALARRTGTALAGGDLARAEKLVCDMVVGGVAPRGSALRRDGARVGDALYVSGRLGGSALGLATRAGSAWKHHLRPEPRLALGAWLRGRATAAMDLSDGLSLDLHRMCLESGVAAGIDRAVPAWRGASLGQVLDGGEDYELLFTARPRVRIPARHGRIPLTRIGTIVRGRPGAVHYFGAPLPPGGWDHFGPR